MAVQSLDRAFDILEILSRERNGLALGEIGRRLDLPKSTVHRLLASLARRGYVERTAAAGPYRLGMAFIGLCSLHLNRLELKTEAQPLLQGLCARTGQTAYLAILQEREVVYIDKAETIDSLRKYSVIGERRPLHCTALGKALLMRARNAEIRRLLAGTTFAAHTPRTLGNLAALLADLEAARRRGWALDDREIEPTVRCVAAPVLDYSGGTIAAVSVSWDMRAHPNVKVTDVAALVMETADAISRRMGYRGGEGGFPP
jgi:IclR family transcriptional regulator, KDG regulon repressor